MSYWVALLIPFIFTFLCFLCDATSENNKKRYFYIYDWHDDLNDVWPPAGAVLHKRSGYNHDFRDNYGAGRLLDEKNGLFQTWQFSLYKVVMSRMRVSEFRTRDPTQASAFIIPYDAGVHSYIDHKDGFPRLASPHGWAAGNYLREASRNKEVFWKNNGHDHFALFSITAYQMVGIGTKVFFMQICQNCSVVTIETSPTRTAIRGRSRKYWIAAPYPSSFHWYEGIQEFPWKISEKAPKRTLVAFFIGSVKTTQPNSNDLRKKLYNQCLQETDCKWIKTAHSCSGVINATSTMLLLREAKYCPAPTGDSVTRKSIFDALVAGCVPVLFSRASLAQYSWHVSAEELEKVSVYIPMRDINEGNLNFMEYLRAIPEEELARKQRAIEILAPSLQYSVIPKRIGDLDSCKIWKSPFRDAADIIIENILNPKTIEPINGFSNEELIQQHELQNHIMDTSEDYAALRGTSHFNSSSSKARFHSKKKPIRPPNETISKILITEADPRPITRVPIAPACLRPL